jgi:hypothetical protein
MAKQKLLVFLSLAVLAALGGCGYEKGFEYKNKVTELQSLNNSSVSGSVVMGYGIYDPTYRIRVKLYRLNKGNTYAVHFLDSSTCSHDDLAKSRRIDGEWGLETYPALIEGSAFGTADQDFRLIAPRHFFDYSKPQVLPTVVITIANGSGSSAESVQPVACGKISSHPSNQRPHT